MSERFIFIDKNTSFEGSITAREVIVEGSIEGDVTASEEVLIKKGGVIEGNIITEKLLFEDGGEHKGLIRLGQSIKEDAASESPRQLSQFISDDQFEQEEQIENTSETTTEQQSPKRLW